VWSGDFASLHRKLKKRVSGEIPDIRSIFLRLFAKFYFIGGNEKKWDLIT